MEWVQTTGASVEEAKDLALDELGVDEQDAEFEVLDEPRSGLFGRVRGEARVKARVRPAEPRARDDRRSRGRSKGKGKGRGRGGNARSKAAGSGGGNGSATTEAPAADRPKKDRSGGRGGGSEQAGVGGGGKGASRAGRGRGKGKGKGNEKRKGGNGEREAGGRRPDGETTKGSTMTEDVAIDEQGELVAGFLEGLLDAFGADGEVHHELVEETTVELRVEGDDLGLLIGPRGATLNAVHEMCRTVLQREVAGGARARIRVDIGGYRERRRQALADFARSQAEGVLEDQTQRALEPMGAADRKVIHDTVNEMDGVRTISEGEDPRRRVVLVPEGD